MSGGSFGNLYGIQDFHTLVGRVDSLKEMADWLKSEYQSSGSESVQLQTLKMVELIEACEKEAMAMLEDLSKVFHAAEWHCSGDWGKDDAIKAIEYWKRRHMDQPTRDDAKAVWDEIGRRGQARLRFVQSENGPMDSQPVRHFAAFVDDDPREDVRLCAIGVFGDEVQIMGFNGHRGRGRWLTPLGMAVHRYGQHPDSSDELTKKNEGPQ